MFNRFKSYLFPIMSDTTPYVTPREISINEDSFINEIKNMKKSINSEIFDEDFWCQNPSFLAKDLIKTDKSKNKRIDKQSIDSINKLKSSIIKKETPKIENQNKMIDVVEKILEYSNQKKGTGLKILTFK